MGKPSMKSVNRGAITLDVAYLYTLACLLSRPLTRKEVLVYAKEDGFKYIDMRSANPLENHFRYLSEAGCVVSEIVRGAQGNTLLFSITPYGVKHLKDSLAAYEAVAKRLEKSL